MRHTLRLFVALAGLAGFASACTPGSGPSSPTPTVTAEPPAAPVPAPPPPPPPPPDRVRYAVTFDAAWSRSTHPQDFPGNPHFSPLIGGTHRSTVSFWQPGGLATEGIRAMAERGLKVHLQTEVEAAISAGHAGFLLSGDGLGTSPASVSLEFDATQAFPLVTLVSMVAPSPDWFVGVQALPLFEGGAWHDLVRVQLYPYDAGTDSGVSFESADEDTQPRQPITRHTGFPFLREGQILPMGTFTFRRVQ
jgi:hypothetical protein